MPLGRRLGLGTGAALAAGLVMLFTRYSAYHLVWITDGNHHLQGLAFLGSALLLVDGPALASFVHVPLIARDGTAREQMSDITLEQLVDAGEALLLEMVKLTRRAVMRCAEAQH